VNFTAQKIDLKKLIRETKSYLKSDPDKLDRDYFDMNGLAGRMMERGDSYLEKRPATKWKTKLEPRPNHWDTKAKLETPLNTW